MKREKSCRMAACLVALCLLTAGAAAAQIQQGIDALHTTNGTVASVNLPADYFCPGSAAVSTSVKLTGVPLATNPPGILAGADTIIERLKDANVPEGGCATVPITARAVNMRSTEILNVFCPATGDTRWMVTACTCGCCGPQPITEITICDDGTGCGCGFFKGELSLNICLKFTNLDDGTVLGPVQDQVTLFVNTPWCDTNPGGAVEAKEAFMVDTDCNNTVDLAVPCTSNFFPGATCGGPGCPPPVCHEGPSPDHQHCVDQCEPKHQADAVQAALGTLETLGN